METRKRILFASLAVAIIVGLFLIVDYFAKITPWTRMYVEWALSFYKMHQPFTYAIWAVPIAVIIIALVTMSEVLGDDSGCILIVAISGIAGGFVVLLPLIIPAVVVFALLYIPFIYILDKLSEGWIREKSIAFDILATVIIVTVIAMMPTTRKEIQWHWALYEDDITSYQTFLDSWSKGRHIGEARVRYEEYSWTSAQDTNTVVGYLNYSEVNPQGLHVQEAETKIATLRANDLLFEAAMRTGTEASIKQFLEDYPEHQKEVFAQQILKDLAEGQDIVDLLREKKIKIKTQGNGIQNVSVSILKLVTYPVKVRIPLGSYFVSSRQSAQNMVTTSERKVELTSNEWISISVPSACANRPKSIPGKDDNFSVRRSPHQAELVKLMPAIEKANTTYEVQQAAVWIVTDNADYNDLGDLVSRGQYQTYGGSRLINVTEAARAIIICHDAGIDIKRKSIWRDRHKIIEGLEDEELISWFQNN